MTGTYSLFQMWGPFRESLIVEHLFYVEQARKRLLSQFVDIEKEADRAAEEWLEKNRHRFDPDRHDEGDFYESAYDAGIEFYQLLSDMQDRTRLSVIAGMFHEWDKKLRQWISDEICHWHKGKELLKAVWKVDFGKLVDLFESFGWKIREKSYFAKLDACRLVVNVYKHGKGTSLDDLKQRYPEYLSAPLSDIIGIFQSQDYLDHTHLSVSDDQLQVFSDAIVDFWKDIPENIFNENVVLPDWVERAAQNDFQAIVRQ